MPQKGSQNSSIRTPFQGDSKNLSLRSVCFWGGFGEASSRFTGGFPGSQLQSSYENTPLQMFNRFQDPVDLASKIRF